MNQIESLLSFQHCHVLEELYLRKNEIAHLEEIIALKHLKKLKVLSLKENPCQNQFPVQVYRAFVIRHLPQLTRLDDKDITVGETHFAHQYADALLTNLMQKAKSFESVFTPSTLAVATKEDRSKDRELEPASSSSSEDEDDCEPRLSLTDPDSLLQNTPEQHHQVRLVVLIFLHGCVLGLTSLLVSKEYCEQCLICSHGVVRRTGYQIT